jgi:hypothetical protein
VSQAYEILKVSRPYALLTIDITELGTTGVRINALRALSEPRPFSTNVSSRFSNVFSTSCRTSWMMGGNRPVAMPLPTQKSTTQRKMRTNIRRILAHDPVFERPRHTR